MNRTFIFMPFLVSLFLSFTASAQMITPECKPSVVDYPLLVSCISTHDASTLFYSIQIEKVISPFMCNSIVSYQQADVMVTNEQGILVDQYLLQQYQFAYEIHTAGTFFHSYDKNLFLLNCMAYQGGGQGGFSVGN